MNSTPPVSMAILSFTLNVIAANLAWSIQTRQSEDFAELPENFAYSNEPDIHVDVHVDYKQTGHQLIATFTREDRSDCCIIDLAEPNGDTYMRNIRASLSRLYQETTPPKPAQGSDQPTGYSW
jgi:hypothetical protein